MSLNASQPDRDPSSTASIVPCNREGDMRQEELGTLRSQPSQKSDDGPGCDNALLAAFQRAWPASEWTDEIVLLAVSGGADSMALLHAAVHLGACLDRIKVIHCNHQLRGVESDEDESFVIDTCLELGVECIAVHLSESERMGVSEEQLREARYKHFLSAAVSVGASWIATAHHLDDNIETFFMRVLRGTGPLGLAGILPRREQALDEQGRTITLVRPLLECRRQTIERWLSEHGYGFRIDSSNASSDYFRNWTRNALLPLLETNAPPGWKDRMGSMLRAQRELLDDSTWKLEELVLGGEIQVLDPHTYQFSNHLLSWMGWPSLRNLLVEIWHRSSWSLRPMSHKHWSSIENALRTSLDTPHPVRLQLPSKVLVEIRQGIVSISNAIR